MVHDPERGPDGKEWAKTEAGYAFVERMKPHADLPGPAWFGWALRIAFVAGAEWQQARGICPNIDGDTTDE